MSVKLPPDPLPPLPEYHTGKPGPYAHSALRDVCGTRINPDAVGWYRRRDLLTNPNGTVVRTCVDPQLDAWLANVSSFDPKMDIVQRPISEWPISAVIAQVDIWGETHPLDIPENSTILVNYADLVANPSARPGERAQKIKERFPGHDLLLGFFGEHRYKLGIWPQTDFWYQPFLDNFEGVFMPDFSAFSDDPIPQSLLGERMMQIFAEEGYNAGKNIVPTVAWRSEDSLRRQLDLIGSLYPKVHTVMLDCYGSHVDPVKWTWRWLFAIEKYMKHLPVRWLIAGITSGWAVAELREMLPNGNFHLVTTGTMHRQALRASLNRETSSLRFAKTIDRLQDMRAGRLRAERLPRPEEWPTFAIARHAESAP